MEYQRHKSFMEMEILRERIASHKAILALNKTLRGLCNYVTRTRRVGSESC